MSADNDVERIALFPSPTRRVIAFALDLTLVGYVATQLPYIVSPIFRFLGVAVLYFAITPATRLRTTPGKWVLRMQMCTLEGERLSWRSALLRALSESFWLVAPFVIGELMGPEALPYCIAILPLPWLPITFSVRRRSLFDLMARSVVVPYRATAAAVSSAVGTAHGINLSECMTSVLLWLFVGCGVVIGTSAQQDRDRRARVAYAITTASVLKEPAQAFYAKTGRWPSAKEIGVAEFNPYPSGGSYALEQHGVIVITFAVLPELRGHRIRLEAKPGDAAGKTSWQCSADSEIHRYVPSACRQY